MTARGDHATAHEPGAHGHGCAPTQKKCAACGETFSCGAPEQGCWCEEVKLTTTTRENLRRRYSDCLCPRCLAAVAGSAK